MNGFTRAPGFPKPGFQSLLRTLIGHNSNTCLSLRSSDYRPPSHYKKSLRRWYNTTKYFITQTLCRKSSVTGSDRIQDIISKWTERSLLRGGRRGESTELSFVIFASYIRVMTTMTMMMCACRPLVIFHRAMHMHKRGICRHAGLSVCPSVCPSVCHVRELCQNQ